MAVRKASPKKSRNSAKKPAAQKKPAKPASKRAKSPAKKPAKPLAKGAAKRATTLRSRKAHVHRKDGTAMRRAVRSKSVLGRNPYETGLDRNPANYQPLTPITFLERAASVFPGRKAVVHGRTSYDYATFYARARRLASALSRQGVRKGDTVAVMLANTPPMLEAHYGVPMTGGVLNTLNTRLDAAALAFILDHGEARVLITDREFSDLIRKTLSLAKTKPFVIDYDDPEFPKLGPSVGGIDYEEFLAGGDPEFSWRMPDDEWDAIALNYTSGTTGNPKGVVFHHRGAALMAYGNVLSAGLSRHPIYLWTLPMFHCNGWCFPWTLSVVAGTHICLRWVRAKPIFDLIADENVTHL